jgi:ABC-type spermidine/putrescine transport system permease subunit I
VKKLTALIVGIILVVIFIVTMFVVPPLLGYTPPIISSWQDFLDSISTPEGLIMGIITQVIPIVCVIVGAIFFVIFLVKLIKGRD